MYLRGTYQEYLGGRLIIGRELSNNIVVCNRSVLNNSKLIVRL